jgi:hypothetical protein
MANGMPYINPGQTRADLPPFDVPPAAGGRSTLRIPVGPTYDTIFLLLEDAGGGRTAAEIAADIDRLRLSVGTRVKWDLTGAEVCYLMAFYGAAVHIGGASPISVGNSGLLPLFLAQPWRQPVSPNPGEANFSNVDGPSYGTLGESSFTLEITWAAGSGCTVATAWAATRPGTPLGTHITLLPLARNLAGAGVDIINDFPIDGNANAYTAMHVGDANLTNAELLINRTRFMDRPAALLDLENGLAGRLVNAAFSSLELCNRDRFADALLETMDDIELRLTFGVAPGDYNIILERIETQELKAQQQTR